MKKYQLFTILLLAVCFGQGRAGFSVITLFGTGDPATSSHITVFANEQDTAYLKADFFNIEAGASLNLWGMDAINNAGVIGDGTINLPNAVEPPQTIPEPENMLIPNPISAGELITMLNNPDTKASLFRTSGDPISVNTSTIAPGIYLLKYNNSGMDTFRKILVTNTEY